MICILKMNQGDIEGWIIATDVDDARRQAHAALQDDLAQLLYGIYELKPGKHNLPTGHVILVS